VRKRVRKRAAADGRAPRAARNAADHGARKPPRSTGASVEKSARSPAVGGAEKVPRLVLSRPEDSLETVLRQASLLVLKHPIAAQAIFSAFVAEGRRFAATPEGRRWKRALADSELVRRGRALWERSVLSMLQDTPDTVIPTSILDAVVQAVGRDDLPDLIELVFAPGESHDFLAVGDRSESVPARRGLLRSIPPSSDPASDQPASELR